MEYIICCEEMVRLLRCDFVGVMTYHVFSCDDMEGVCVQLIEALVVWWIVVSMVDHLLTRGGWSLQMFVYM